MLEAIAHLRSQLGLVVFLWIKSHNGASTSSYPDLAAKMYLQAPQEDEITKIVGDLVYTRPCVYERHMTSEDEEGSERWGLADRKVYKEGRLRARGSVRARLAELLKPGATTAGETRPLWTQIVKAAMRRPDADGGMIGLEQVKDYNTRTKVVMAARSKNTPGMPHDAAWARIHRVELTNGENGTASISRSWGCALCRRKKNTDIEKRNMGRRRQDRRDRQGWKDYDDEAEVCANTMSSTRHTLTGLCAGTDAELVVSMQRHMTSLHKEAEKAANSGGGAGTDVMGVLDLAKEAVDAVALGNVVSDAQYVALNQTIASTLPVWSNSQGKQTNKQPGLSNGLMLLQDTAGKLVEQHLEKIRPHTELCAQRQRLRDRMHVVLRAWREEVEHSGAAHNSALRWRIRRPEDIDRRAGSILRARIQIPSSIKPRVNRLLETRTSQSDEDIEKQAPEPRSDWTVLQCVEAIRTCMRVSATRPALAWSHEHQRFLRKPKPAPPPDYWNILRKGRARVVEMIKRQRQQAKKDSERRGENERASRRDTGEARIDYREGTPRRRRAPGEVQVGLTVQPTIIRARRRENTTRVARIGMELHGWMRKIGEQVNRARGWRRGIG